MKQIYLVTCKACEKQFASKKGPIGTWHKNSTACPYCNSFEGGIVEKITVIE